MSIRFLILLFEASLKERKLSAVNTESQPASQGVEMDMFEEKTRVNAIIGL